MVNLRETLNVADCSAIRELVAATGMFRPNEVEVAVELVEERRTRGESSGYHFVLAEQDSQLIGYVCFGPIAVTLYSYDVYWIAVHPQWQGKGIGRQLLHSAEQRIAGLGGRQIYLETSGQSTYAATRSFYERCGYSLEATIAEFYAPDDPKLIYVRRLLP